MCKAMQMPKYTFKIFLAEYLSLRSDPNINTYIIKLWIKSNKIHLNH